MSARKEGNDPLVSGKKISISRLVDAPVELVWQVWTDPDHIRNWWGPAGFTNTIRKMDIRPGGEWDFVMHGPDGQDYKNLHLFREVIPKKKLVMEHITGPRFTFSAAFEARGRQTMIHIESVFESEEILQQVIKSVKADQGLKQNMDRLAYYADMIFHKKTGVIIQEPEGFEVRFKRLLPYSAKAVWQALTDPAQLAIWFTDIKMDFRPGGEMTIWFRDEDKTPSSGKIIRIEPYQLFEFTWEEELATWEIDDQGPYQCVLTLTYSRLPESYAHHVPAGWHLILDQLETVLAGRTNPYPFGGEETPESRSLKFFYTERMKKQFPELKIEA